MANEFLISKWKRLFALFDVNKDGIICEKDMVLFTEKFFKVYKINDVKADDIKPEIAMIWNEFLLQGSTVCSETQFVDLMSQKYDKSVEEFVQFVRKYLVIFVSLCDNNNDGMISKDEFRNLLKSLGVKSFHDKHFNAHPQSDGQVKSELFLESWVAFCCNEDENGVGELEKIRLYGFRMVKDTEQSNDAITTNKKGNEEVKLTILDHSREIDIDADANLEMNGELEKGPHNI